MRALILLCLCGTAAWADPWRAEGEIAAGAVPAPGPLGPQGGWAEAGVHVGLLDSFSADRFRVGPELRFSAVVYHDASGAYTLARALGGVRVEGDPFRWGRAGLLMGLWAGAGVVPRPSPNDFVRDTLTFDAAFFVGVRWRFHRVALSVSVSPGFTFGGWYDPLYTATLQGRIDFGL